MLRAVPHIWQLGTLSFYFTMVLAGLTPHHIIVLNAADATVTKRVLERARQASSAGGTVRVDDNEQTILKRLEQYHANRDAVLNEFDKFLRLSTIDGEPSVNNVSGAVRSAIGS